VAEFPVPPPGGPASGKRLESARFVPPYGVTGDFLPLLLAVAEYPTPVYRIPAGGLWVVIKLWILDGLAARSRHYLGLHNFLTLLLR
jgi:hypothetical protein